MNKPSRHKNSCLIITKIQTLCLKNLDVIQNTYDYGAYALNQPEYDVIPIQVTFRDSFEKKFKIHHAEHIVKNGAVQFCHGILGRL